ncbi:hypothetical protein BDF20DRAFT_915873 [Mycotypha africana]|uniref:uncharacterized protein n=1 Tax=Mycotypha africana TaxID=64632 RepID=UPI002300815B|nr:uncharacterized protein BDF20DRAFT_915873 [Mycotypha africana]KAI8969986.1 hypothetical protein BDF20DRAFT_915873 [Mycotypha africana]
MHITEKLKNRIELWRLEKYTKRRSFLPEFDSKDSAYYKQIYHDGVYDLSTPYRNKRLSARLNRASLQLKNRASNMFGRPSSPPAPCSENYNKNFLQS